MVNMKILISGHGGHLCEARHGTLRALGRTIDEAVGCLVSRYPKEFGIDVEINGDCDAYNNSWQTGKAGRLTDFMVGDQVKFMEAATCGAAVECRDKDVICRISDIFYDSNKLSIESPLHHFPIYAEFHHIKVVCGAD